MIHKLIDHIDYLKVTGAGLMAFIFTFANADFLIKLAVAAVTIGYTLRKWYREEKQNKPKKKK
jgi:hypothetical protein